MFKHPLYLVPHDFSEISNSAARLALDLAEANDGSAYLLHIVSKDSEKAEARRTFDNLVSELSSEDQGRLSTKVIVGDLFEDVVKLSATHQVE